LGHVPRSLSDGTVSDRDRLRTEYQEMCLEDYNDMQAYITAFKNKVHTLRDLGLGLVADDGDVLYQFNKGLPSAWTNYMSIVSALQLSFSAAVIVIVLSFRRYIRFRYYMVYEYVNK
jgi:hypothetical protein